MSTPPPPPPPPGGSRGPRDPQYQPDDGQFEFSGSEFERDNHDDEFARQSRNWGMLCHLSALSAFVGVPFGHLAGPLLVWLIKRNEYPYVDEQGKESLNFQLSMTLYGIIAAILVFVVVGVFLLLALGVLNIVAVIVASVRANDGRPIRYPLTIRFLK